MQLCDAPSGLANQHIHHSPGFTGGHPCLDPSGLLKKSLFLKKVDFWPVKNN